MEREGPCRRTPPRRGPSWRKTVDIEAPDDDREPVDPDELEEQRAPDFETDLERPEADVLEQAVRVIDEDLDRDPR